MPTFKKPAWWVKRDFAWDLEAWKFFWHFTNGWDLDCRQCHFSMSLFSCAEVFSSIVPFRPPLWRNLLRSSHFKKVNKKIFEKSERKSEKHVEVKTSSGATINTSHHISTIISDHTTLFDLRTLDECQLVISGVCGFFFKLD